MWIKTELSFDAYSDYPYTYVAFDFDGTIVASKTGTTAKTEIELFLFLIEAGYQVSELSSTFDLN